MGSGCDVSEHVLFDILLYLPVISLLRFKTVCKCWYSIIESSIFITEHLNHNSEKSNLIINGYESKLSMLSGRKYDLCSNLDFERIDPVDSIDAVNSCNGIVCMAQHWFDTVNYGRLSLWNPATKQVRQLPELSFLDSSSDYTSIVFYYFAIGFDVKTKDYKVVGISLDFGDDELLKNSLVQVYSMRSDSWRTIHKGDDFPIIFIDFSINVACNSGVCFWIGVSSSKSSVIFYFDLMDEVYGTLSLPDDGNDVRAQSLAFLNDKVTYVNCKWGQPCHSYEIWTMDEFGVNESWSRVYKLDDPILLPNQLSFANLLNNGKFILTQKFWEVGLQYDLCLLDVVTEEEKLLNVQNARTVISYSESLVSLKRTT